METACTKTLYAIALLSAASVAQAGGWQHYGGSQCQPVLAADSANLATTTTGVRNLGSQTLYVTCPVIRQQLFSTNGVQQAYVTVKSNGSGTLSCTLVNLSSLDYAYSATASTTSATVTSLNVKLTQSNSSGHYAISCALPPNGRVSNYWIKEYEQ